MTPCFSSVALYGNLVHLGCDSQEFAEPWHGCIPVPWFCESTFCKCSSCVWEVAELVNTLTDMAQNRELVPGQVDLTGSLFCSFLVVNKGVPVLTHSYLDSFNPPVERVRRTRFFMVCSKIQSSPFSTGGHTFANGPLHPCMTHVHPAHRSPSHSAETRIYNAKKSYSHHRHYDVRLAKIQNSHCGSHVGVLHQRPRRGSAT